LAQRATYNRVSITLHWTTAFFVVVNFLLAEFWDDFAKPTHHLMVVTHISFGVLLAAVILLRVFWRSAPANHVQDATSGLQKMASKAVHMILYALVIAQIVLGLLLTWGRGGPLDFFGLMIPSPIGPLSKSAHHLAGTLHNYNAWAIIVIAGGHATMALVHHFYYRDDVLKRMLPLAK
jgi:cytochrome b561